MKTSNNRSLEPVSLQARLRRALTALAAPKFFLCAVLLLGVAPGALAQLTLTFPPQATNYAAGDNAEMYVLVAGGTPPYTYAWTTNGTPVITTSPNLVLTNVVVGLSGAAVAVTVTDSTTPTPDVATTNTTLIVNSTFNPANNLALWLPFDDGLTTPSSQTAADASGNNNNGTLLNFESDGFEWVPGRMGGALFFANTNGLSNNVVTVQDAPNLNFNNNLAFSVSLWVVAAPYYYFEGAFFGSSLQTNVQPSAGIITKGFGNGGEQFDLDINSSDFRFFVRSGAGGTAGPQTSTALNLNGVWQHVVATCDVNAGVTNISVYVNGARVNAVAVGFTNLLADGGLPVTIGNRSSSSSSGYVLPFAGTIDDVRIYDYALSAGDVSTLYTSYTAANPAVFKVAAPTIYAGGNMPLVALEGGSPGPVSNLWTFSGTNSVSTVKTNPVFVITNLAAGFDGNASLIVSNANGLATTNSLSVTGLAAPYPAAAAVMALGPLAFWQLNEPVNPAGAGANSVIYDYAGGNNALAQDAVTMGNSGVPNSPYGGFPANYQSALMNASSSQGFLWVPPFGLTSAANGVTFTAWINCNSGISSSSQGIIYSRSGQGGGMDWNGYIGYTWNNNSSSTYGFNSHLTPAPGTWAFAVVSIGASSTIIYMGTNGLLLSATNSVSNTETSPAWTQEGLIYIADDANSSTPYKNSTGRIFPGKINNVAVFPYNLSAAQVQYLYYSAVSPPLIGTLPASTNVSLNQNLSLSIPVKGMTNMSYLWYIINTNGTSNTLASGAISSFISTNTVIVPNIQSTNNDATVTFAVTDPSGGTSTASTVLNVFAAPTIITFAPTNATIFTNESVTFTVSAEGALPLAYYWSTNAKAISLPLATTSFTLAPQQSAGAITVSCAVSNLVGKTTTNGYVTVVAATNAYPQAVLALHPFGYWRLNEHDDGLSDGNDGHPCNDYANGNNGIYTNTVLGQPGYDSGDSAFPGFDPETSAQFDVNPPAVNNNNSCVFAIPNIDVSVGAGTNAEFTVSAWVNGLGQSGGAPGIAAKGIFGNEEFTLDTGDGGVNYRFTMRDAATNAYYVNSTLAASDGKWHHLVGVCDEANSNCSFYIDGLLVNSLHIAPGAGCDAADAAVPMTIGARSSNVTLGNDQQFNGSINDVVLFTNALTASQVQQLFGSAGEPPVVALQTNLVVVDENGNATNSVAVSGTPMLVLQWYDIDNTGNTNLLTGDTEDTLVLTDVQQSQSAYQYFAVVTNAYGATTSSIFTLSIVYAPIITQDLPATTTYTYADLPKSFSVQALGSLPLYYIWLTNGVADATATNSTYDFLAMVGTNTYQCIVSNNSPDSSPSPQTAYSHTATIVGGPTPQDPYSIALLSYGPTAYWQLNEPSGSTVAFDYVGGYNGAYGAATSPGQAGLPDPPFLGLPGDDLAVQMNNTATTGFITVSGGINLNTNTVTILCWAYSYAPQTNPVGLVYCRYNSGGSVFGSQLGAANGFTYTWDNLASTYDYGSGLDLPNDVWTLLALTTTPTNAILYLYNAATVASGLTSATNPVANVAQNFVVPAGTTDFAIGADPQASTLPGRIFNGEMADVAIFNYPLSKTQMNTLYTVGANGFGQLAISVSGGNVTVTWPFGTLQQATSVYGPWTAVPGATAPSYQTPVTGHQVFYRFVNESP